MDFSITNVRDVVGLYVNGPDAVMAFRADEEPKPAIPDVAQMPRPSLDRRGGVSREALIRFMIQTMLGQLIGKRVGSCPHLSGVVHFLDLLDLRIANRWELHVVLTTADLRPTSALKAWFAAHARFHAHIPPTSALWIDEVGRWLAQTSREKTPSRSRGFTEMSSALGSYYGIDGPEIPLAWISPASSRFTRRRDEGDISLGHILSILCNLDSAGALGQRQQRR
jgi:hypothetical protein